MICVHIQSNSPEGELRSCMTMSRHRKPPPIRNMASSAHARLANMCLCLSLESLEVYLDMFLSISWVVLLMFAFRFTTLQWIVHVCVAWQKLFIMKQLEERAGKPQSGLCKRDLYRLDTSSMPLCNASGVGATNLCSCFFHRCTGRQSALQLLVHGCPAAEDIVHASQHLRPGYGLPVV